MDIQDKDKHALVNVFKWQGEKISTCHVAVHVLLAKRLQHCCHKRLLMMKLFHDLMGFTICSLPSSGISRTTT